MKKYLFLMIILSLVFVGCDGDGDSDDPKVTGMTIEDVANVCNAQIACGLDEGESSESINECVNGIISIQHIDDDSLMSNLFFSAEILDLFKTSITCMDNSKTCDDYASCLKTELTDTECTPSTFENSCEDNKTLICNNFGKVVKKDCSFFNQTCEDGECNDPENTECNDEEYVSTCVDDIQSLCFGGKIVKYSCKAYLKNGVCRTMGNNTVCATENPVACDASFVESCEGSYRVSCSGKEVTKTDCKFMYGDDFTCSLDADGYTNCVYKELTHECEDGTKCNGSSIEYCVNGQNKTFDCKANGYSSCVEAAQGIPAYCAF